MDKDTFEKYLIPLVIMTFLLSITGLIIAPLCIAGAMSLAGGLVFSELFSSILAFMFGIPGIINPLTRSIGIGVFVLGLALLFTTIFAPPLAAMIVILVFSSLCVAAAAALAIGSKLALPAEDKEAPPLQQGVTVEPEAPVASYGATFNQAPNQEEKQQLTMALSR